jgi:hypothetical protein
MLRVFPRVAPIFLAAAAAGVLSNSAFPEDRSAWFKSLTQPGTGMSCCDIADCRRTEADWREGQWWANVEGRWTPIPKDKELSKNSIDGDAYVCSGAGRRVYCFVPPDMAM